MSTIEKLYQRNNKESSPAELDHLILAAAKQSCEKESDRKKTKWIYALPTAAVVMLSLSLIINLQNENQTINTMPVFDVESPELETLSKTKEKSLIKKETPKRKREQRLEEMVQESQQPTPVVAAPQIEEAPKIEAKKMYAEPSILEETNPTIGALSRTVPAKQIENENSFKFKKPAKKNISYNIADDGFADSVSLIENDKGLEINKAKKPKKDSNTFLLDINKLDQLIEQQKFKQAKELLTVLKQKYPDYDFTKYDISI